MEKFKNHRLTELKTIIGGSGARNTSDLPRDRNNVQNPFRALYDYNPYEPLFD